MNITVEARCPDCSSRNIKQLTTEDVNEDQYQEVLYECQDCWCVSGQRDFT